MNKIKTRNNIFYDLSLSDFKFKTDDDVTFCFSSKLYKDKFVAQHLDYRRRVSNYLTKTYSIDVSTSLFADVVLYTKIEKRGFLILSVKGEKLCKEKILLNGAMIVLKS